MENALRGVLGFKGERGFSAYEIAVQNGYIGSEKNWLASIGQTSMFKKEKTMHTSVTGQTVFSIPEEYTSDSIIDVYINGIRLNEKEYIVDTSSMQIVLSNELDEGAEVEILVSTMTTNHLPFVTIEETIPEIPAEGNSSLEIEFPVGFTSENCVIISKMSKLEEFWYDCADLNVNSPVVTSIKIGTNIVVNMKNPTNTVKDGQFKLVLAKI